MDSSIQLWLEYLLRFSHLVAGIAWIGSSFYFIWLDSNFVPPTIPRQNVEGELFMVHGGFYYQVEKKKIYPGELPDILHWFKWEATLTWVTGFLLFTVVYYLRGASLLIDPHVMDLSASTAVALSLTLLAASWFIYDLVWSLKFLEIQFLKPLLSLLFFGSLIFLNFKIFSGRGAFIQTGVIFGSIMLLNVWVRILPGQSKMLKEAQSGQIPDYSVSLKSKTRSVHNTYFTFPVLFIMISNHYPSVYNHSENWILLILLSCAGALIRHAMVAKKRMERWTLLPAGLGLLALVYMTQPPVSAVASQEVIPFQKVSGIFQARCVTCHSSNPTDDVYRTAPKGILLENETQIRTMTEQIYQQAVVSKVMPLGNKTQMTLEERELLGLWLRRQTP